MNDTPGTTPEPRADVLALRAWPLHAAALVALIVAVYANVLDAPLVLDDVTSIVRNPAVRSVDAWIAARGWANPRCLSYLTLAIDGSLYGGSLRGLHFTNILIHCGATWLSYLLVRALFSAPVLARSRLAPHGPTVALITAALFAAHPLQTQAVTYVTQRMASLSALFYILAVLAWVRARTASSRTPAVAWSATLVLATVAAFFSKQNAATLPFAIAIVELAFFDGPRRRLAWLLGPAAVMALLLLSSVLRGTESVETAVEARFLSGVSGWQEYLFTQFRALVAYLRLLFFPRGLSIEHGFAVSRSLLEPAVLASLTLLLAMGGAGLWLLVTGRRRDPAWRGVGAGILWWFAAHAVESSVIPIADLMVEHRTYLPSFGIFLAVAIAGTWTWHALRAAHPGGARALGVASLALVIVLAFLAHARNEVWRDDVRLWSDAAQKAPWSPRANQNLGVALGSKGRFAEAAAAFQATIRARPTDALAHYGMAIALEAQGRKDLARAWEAEGNRLGALHQRTLGELLLDAGAFAAAAKELQLGTRADPRDARIRRSLGYAQLGVGDRAAAEAELRRATQLAPTDASAHLGLALALRASGKVDLADRAREAALALDPDVEAHAPWPSLRARLAAPGTP